MANYRLPLKLQEVTQGKEFPACDLPQSITQHLELIIMTKFGEHRHDPSFGCEIWDLDFELIVSASLWEEKLRQSLLRSVSTHEQRLQGIEITVAINDMEKFNALRNFSEVKKRVSIKLTGTIRKTGEPFIFSTYMFLSPLTFDQ